MRLERMLWNELKGVAGKTVLGEILDYLVTSGTGEGGSENFLATACHMAIGHAASRYRCGGIAICDTSYQLTIEDYEKIRLNVVVFPIRSGLWSGGR